MPKELSDENITQSIAKNSIALSAALSVQDAANTMRDMNTLLSTASGVALANFIESGDPMFLDALGKLNQPSKASTKNFVDLYATVSELKKIQQRTSKYE